jgi:hypothetical protein
LKHSQIIVIKLHLVEFDKKYVTLFSPPSYVTLLAKTILKRNTIQAHKYMARNLNQIFYGNFISKWFLTIKRPKSSNFFVVAHHPF